MERETDRGVDGSHGSGGLCKTSCQDEDPEHHHQIFISRTSAKYHYTVGNGEFARFVVFAHSHFRRVVLVGDEEGIGRCNDEDHHERHFVEIAPSDAEGEKERDEHKDGT